MVGSGIGSVGRTMMVVRVGGGVAPWGVGAAVGKSGGSPSVGSGSVGMTMVGKGSVGSGKVGSGRPRSGVGVAVGALWVGPDGVWLGLAVGGTGVAVRTGSAVATGGSVSAGVGVGPATVARRLPVGAKVAVRMTSAGVAVAKRSSTAAGPS